MQKLFIISNESIYFNNNEYFCDNIDLKSTPEGLGKKFEVNIIARKSQKKRSFRIDIKNICISKSIFKFILEVLKAVRIKESKFLIISLSPYTFLACLCIRILGKIPTIYLRSDGYGEYKSILGFIGPAVYHFMFSISSLISNLISCQKFILRNKKGNVLSPSQLDEDWFVKSKKKVDLDDIKLLYVGRIRVEKGIYSLINMIKNKYQVSLTVVGAEKNAMNNIDQHNVKVIQTETTKRKLIDLYDNHNVFILPSFTEGHPMALLEALARKRPVIIFEDIKHVVGEKRGIFVSKRTFEELSYNINYIINNYKKIQTEMEKNVLPTKKDFLKDLINLLNDG